MATDLNLLLGMYESGFLNNQDFLTSSSWLILARYYRSLSQHNKSYDCIQQGKKLSSIEHEFDEEMSIIAYYLGKMEEGYIACENIINSSSFSQEIRMSTHDNINFYTAELELQEVVIFPCTPTSIILQDNIYYCSNGKYVTSFDKDFNKILILPIDDKYLLIDNKQVYYVNGNITYYKKNYEIFEEQPLQFEGKLSPCISNGTLYFIGYNPIRIYSLDKANLILSASIINNDIRDYSPIGNIIYYNEFYLGLATYNGYYRFFRFNKELTRIVYGISFKYKSNIIWFVEHNNNIIVMSDDNRILRRDTLLNMFKNNNNDGGVFVKTII